MWTLLQFVLLLTVSCAVCDDAFDVQGASQESHGLSEVDGEGWRAIDKFQEDESVWVPRDLPQERFEEQVPKRRRLRKRKRRPVQSSFIDDLNSEEVLPDRVLSGGRRRTLPQRLELNMDSWREMAEDDIRKPNIRRRVTPGFQPSDEVSEENDFNPDTNLNIREETPEKEEEKVVISDEDGSEKGKNDNNDAVTPKNIISDLKAVLKQSGTGSLSEILQQKNLSLSEFLMGNQKAISALTETPLEVTEAGVDTKTPIVTDTTKYKRLPPSIGLRKEINRNFEQEGDSFEEMFTKKMLEAQRKRLSLIGHKDNKLFSTVTKYDVITEPTTERRIFVPSHPKYHTTQVFKPNINTDDEQTLQETIKEHTTSTTTITTTTPKVIETTSSLDLKPTVKILPLTNAKIHKLTTAKVPMRAEKEEEEEEEVDNYPIPFKFPKPIQIDIQEVTGFKHKPNKAYSDVEGQDEPVKMSIDLNDFIEERTESANYPYHKTTPLAPESTTLQELDGEKVVPATAKDEIMEIMKDPISRERLSRILESRNMTITELVEQRERGSSQLHLADIFHNKTREPEPKGEPFVGTINTEYFNSFPLFGRQQKSKNFGSDPSNNHMPTANPSSIVPVVRITEKTTIKPIITVTSFPAVKIGLQSTKQPIQPFLWNTLESDLLSPILQSDNKETSTVKLNDPIKEFQDDSHENDSHKELQRLDDDVDSTLSLVSNEKLDVGSNSIQEEEEVLINIPSGVKSAIFVSLAIICLSILVFLTILLVFKWTQRQSKRISYCNSLSANVKSPIIIQKRPTTAIRSFVNETLGRKKNYYKSNVQSTDELWECGRERMPSF